MGNCGSTSPVSLGKAHVPHLEWKIHDFEAVVGTRAKSAISSHFHYSGYKWFLQVTPSTNKRTGVETPYVGLRLKLCWTSLEPGDTVNAVFELSVYNHSKRRYYGYKASHNFDLDNTISENECLVPLQELLKPSAFLVDDSCIFGVKILKIRVTSSQKKDVVVQKKATTLQNLFVQKKGFIKGTYTWTMDNYLELESKHFVQSPTFEVGGHKWHVSMYPRGSRHITDCVSLYLSLESSDELSAECGKVVELTLSILNQKNGKHFTRTTGLWVFPGASGRRWPKFMPLHQFKFMAQVYGPMNCLSWNCCGCGNVATIRELDVLVKAHIPKFVFLCETRQKKDKVEKMKRRLGLSGFAGWDSDGMSGGLALFWHESLLVEVKDITSRYIDVHVRESASDPMWHATFVYGEPRTDQRHHICPMLFASDVDIAMVCCRGF